MLAPAVLLTAGVVGLFSVDSCEPLGIAFAAWWVLLAWGAWSPVRNRWALRAFAAPIPWVCIAYLVHEIRTNPGNALPQSRSETHPVNAILALLAFGMPAAAYALTGRFRWWSSDDPGIGDSELEPGDPGGR